MPQSPRLSPISLTSPKIPLLSVARTNAPDLAESHCQRSTPTKQDDLPHLLPLFGPKPEFLFELRHHPERGLSFATVRSPSPSSHALQPDLKTIFREDGRF